MNIVYRNKLNGRLYTITNEACENGICQVLDMELNHVVMMKRAELVDATESALNFLQTLHETLNNHNAVIKSPHGLQNKQ